MKITAILGIVFMFIGSLWAAGMCNSCGNECAPACGTRYFRTCCFNYLRKKRGDHRLPYQTPHEKNLPGNYDEDMFNDFKLYPFDDINERLIAMYDA